MATPYLTRNRAGKSMHRRPQGGSSRCRPVAQGEVPTDRALPGRGLVGAHIACRSGMYRSLVSGARVVAGFAERGARAARAVSCRNHSCDSFRVRAAMVCPLNCRSFVRTTRPIVRPRLRCTPHVRKRAALEPTMSVAYMVSAHGRLDGGEPLTLNWKVAVSEGTSWWELRRVLQDTHVGAKVSEHDDIISRDKSIGLCGRGSPAWIGAQVFGRAGGRPRAGKRSMTRIGPNMRRSALQACCCSWPSGWSKRAAMMPSSSARKFSACLSLECFPSRRCLSMRRIVSCYRATGWRRVQSSPRRLQRMGFRSVSV